MPYRLRLRYRFFPGLGFDAEQVRGPLPGVRGGFRLRDLPDGCAVTHFESYDFGGGVLARVFERFWRPYIRWTMQGEVKRLARIAEERARVRAVKKP